MPIYEWKLVLLTERSAIRSRSMAKNGNWKKFEDIFLFTKFLWQGTEYFVLIFREFITEIRKFLIDIMSYFLISDILDSQVPVSAQRAIMGVEWNAQRVILRHKFWRFVSEQRAREDVTVFHLRTNDGSVHEEQGGRIDFPLKTEAIAQNRLICLLISKNVILTRYRKKSTECFKSNFTGIFKFSDKWARIFGEFWNTSRATLVHVDNFLTNEQGYLGTFEIHQKQH